MEKRVFSARYSLTAILKHEGSSIVVHKCLLMPSRPAECTITKTTAYSAAGMKAFRNLIDAAHEIAAAWDRDPEAALMELQNTEGA